MEANYEVNLNLNNVAVGNWDICNRRVEILKMRGSFWRTFGFCVSTKNYLHPEEALLLLERASILIQNEQCIRIPLASFYGQVVDIISIHCYLVYVKLRNLEYITFRYNSDSNMNVKSFSTNEEIIARAREFPSKSLLEVCVSFKLYTQCFNWSKKLMAETNPVGLVVLVHGDFMISPRLSLTLLEQAKGVPIIFAVVTATYYVMLQELTDARTSICWENAFRSSLTMTPLSIEKEHERCSLIQRKLKQSQVAGQEELGLILANPQPNGPLQPEESDEVEEYNSDEELEFDNDVDVVAEDGQQDENGAVSVPIEVDISFASSESALLENDAAYLAIEIEYNENQDDISNIPDTKRRKIL